MSDRPQKNESGFDRVVRLAELVIKDYKATLGSFKNQDNRDCLANTIKALEFNLNALKEEKRKEQDEGK